MCAGGKQRQLQTAGFVGCCHRGPSTPSPAASPRCPRPLSCLWPPSAPQRIEDPIGLLPPKLILGINKRGVHFFRPVPKEYLHSAELRDIMQFGSSSQVRGGRVDAEGGRVGGWGCCQQQLQPLGSARLNCHPAFPSPQRPAPCLRAIHVPPCLPCPALQAVFFKMRVAGVLHIFQFESKQGEDICMALQTHINDIMMKRYSKAKAAQDGGADISGGAGARAGWV